MRYSRLCFSFMSQHCGDLTVGVTITGDDMGLSDQVCDAILNFYIWIKNKARVSILKLMFVMMFSCRQGEKDLSLVSLGLSHGLMDKISPYWRVRGETNPDLVKPGSNVNGWFRWNLTGLVAPIKCKQNRQIYKENLTLPSHINNIPGDPAILRLLEKKCHKWGQKI